MCKLQGNAVFVLQETWMNGRRFEYSDTIELYANEEEAKARMMERRASILDTFQGSYPDTTTIECYDNGFEIEASDYEDTASVYVFSQTIK